MNKTILICMTSMAGARRYSVQAGQGLEHRPIQIDRISYVGGPLHGREYTCSPDARPTVLLSTESEPKPTVPQPVVFYDVAAEHVEAVDDAMRQIEGRHVELEQLIDRYEKLDMPNKQYVLQRLAATDPSLPDYKECGRCGKVIVKWECGTAYSRCECGKE